MYLGVNQTLAMLKVVGYEVLTRIWTQVCLLQGQGI